MNPTGEPHSPTSSRRWIWWAALALAGCAAGAWLLLDGQPAAVREDPRAQVARRAAERLEGARCVGARASPQEQAAIARLLAVDIISPRGRLPAWLPEEFLSPAPGAVDGSAAWNRLAAGCAHAPAFGTPFGFPSAEIEQALRQDAGFAAQSDREWGRIRAYEAGRGSLTPP